MVKPRIVSLMGSRMYADVITPATEEKLRSFTEVVLNPHDTSPSDSEMAKLLTDADGCLTGWGVIVPETAIASATGLRIIGHTAGSVKRIVPKLAYERGIVVLSAWKLMAKSVGEMAFAMAVAGMRNFAAHDYAFKVCGTAGDRTIRGSATRSGLSKTFGLHHTTIGIIGASATGRYFIRLLKGYGDDVNVLVYDPYLPESDAEALGVAKVPLPELLSQSEVVSLHAPRTPETEGMMNKEVFALMKDGALFINTARGALVDHNALYAELETGRLKACLDVYLETCPDPANSPYRKLRNVLITPGIAGPSAQVLQTMGAVIVDDFERFFSGKEPEHRVDPNRLGIIA